MVQWVEWHGLWWAWWGDSWRLWGKWDEIIDFNLMDVDEQVQADDHMELQMQEPALDDFQVEALLADSETWTEAQWEEWTLWQEHAHDQVMSDDQMQEPALDDFQVEAILADAETWTEAEWEEWILWQEQTQEQACWDMCCQVCC